MDRNRIVERDRVGQTDKQTGRYRRRAEPGRQDEREVNELRIMSECMSNTKKERETEKKEKEGEGGGGR